jgi:NAD(P)-dependent dehydrogenase (short-subunit alcohol dehydrogenase family)
VALVTGTGAGIGRGIALAFAQAGYDLALCDINAAELQETVIRVRALGRRAYAQAFDLRSAEDIGNFVDQAAHQLGRIDVLVNNAGVMRLYPAANLPVQAVDEMLAVNLRAAILFSKYAVPYLQTAGGGSILHMGSVHAYNGHADASVYAATKGALLALARSQAVELAGANIRVNSVSPGTVDSPMLHDFVARHSSEPAKALAAFAALHPRGRLASIEEVAQCFVFLASSAAANVTGTDLRCDGGYCIQGSQPKH